jgi:hypothetical protein
MVAGLIRASNHDCLCGGVWNQNPVIVIAIMIAFQAGSLVVVKAFPSSHPLANGQSFL